MFLKFGEQGKDITYRIMILAICLIMLSLELIPICCATTGAVIIFERKNEVLGGDVGHVGVAIQLEDGSWVAGAVEGPGGLDNVVGVIAGNGGWISDLGVFKTKEDVINEFAMDRTTYSNGIIPHDPYDKMVTIEVQNPNYSNALSAMENFPARGFAVWANNDCLTSVDDVLRAYNVEALPRKPTILENPNTYFYLLAADHDGWSALPAKKPNLASLLKPGLLSPLLAAPTSDMSSNDYKGESNAPESTSSSNTQSTNNIIGKWDTTSKPPFSPIIFYSDGTFETGSWYGDGTSHPTKLATGTWIQSGDNIMMTRAGCSDCPIVLQIGPNSLNFNGPGADIMWYKGGGGAVSSAVAGVGPLVDEGQNGGGGW